MEGVVHTEGEIVLPVNHGLAFHMTAAQGEIGDHPLSIAIARKRNWEPNGNTRVLAWNEHAFDQPPCGEDHEYDERCLNIIVAPSAG